MLNEDNYNNKKVYMTKSGVEVTVIELNKPNFSRMAEALRQFVKDVNDYNKLNGR
ncbi:hypothetical protein [Alkalihalobacillus trypoxylicola]|uniref:hypothetical protein n=1 Tax=Alkalihalobacillus trypoxylicola TaxID=519424 RepID=UPI000B12A82B|nr:hypothetical protein [Alkalihalobacillus trypoxylicola]